MLYTSAPLERIYANLNLSEADKKKELEKQRREAEYRDVSLPYGRVVTRREGENYIIERINSTNMSDYLNEEYFPGKPFKNSENK
jgi:hypothetical protein